MGVLVTGSSGAGGGGGGKVCESCKGATATVYCRADSAYLCNSCDSKIHAANKLASRHARIWVCEVCEQAPASVTCKADAAHLCPSCDNDIHSANPLSRRHDRVPLHPFFHNPLTDTSTPTDTTTTTTTVSAAEKSAAISRLFGEEEYYSDADEAEAASWLKQAQAGDETKSIEFLFSSTNTTTADHNAEALDPYGLDLDFGASEGKLEHHQHQNASVNTTSADGVVPSNPDSIIDDDEHDHKPFFGGLSAVGTVAVGNGYHFDGYDHNGGGVKAYGFNTYNAAPVVGIVAAAAQPALSHSVSSSSMDYGVVPDASALADVASTGFDKNQQMKMMGLDREARVLRYKEKRKNRKFEKTIRYASRKAYAETRPRIKGRFAKRTDVEAAATVDSLFASDPGYGVVPSY